MSEEPIASFEEIVKRLEKIADLLESGQPELEESLRLFEEGVLLAKRGNKELDAAERRLEVLLEDGEKQPFVVPGSPAAK